ncbi:helix-turn-helix domain-containing protein [Kineosporia sp. J2-2]|uniref:Helix-turn-helix domain-containing protein n=1 Tax=Kineosporia corallincola TaxID=2835133 RepID=A0ABS5TM28_9ACTN|nr:helix-turn-helix transcriptional regulator [Kineosporia corallincola]MBT0772060.1 helix-turn-helix domain-containing protein [Kineosporia corallincola]
MSDDQQVPGAGQDPHDPAAATTPEQFIRALASRRLAAGDSYRTLQTRTGIPVSTLNDTLTGRRKPRGPVVHQLIDAYAADPHQAERWLGTWTSLLVHEAAGAPAPPPSASQVTAPRVDDESPVPSTTTSHRSTGGTRAWVLVGVTTLLVVLVAGLLWQVAVTGEETARTPGARIGADVEGTSIQVFNVEKPCRSQHIRECALSLSRSPWNPTGEENVAGRVWHDDQLITDCVISDGRLITDETGVSSHRWYHVKAPAGGVIGWLPAVRTRSDQDVPPCRTPQPSPSVP